MRWSQVATEAKQFCERLRNVAGQMGIDPYAAKLLESAIAEIDRLKQAHMAAQAPHEHLRLPLRVEYYRRCEEWDEKSLPRIVDANGRIVCEMPQTVGHPGKYDPIADFDANFIVSCVNGHTRDPF